MLCRFLKQNPYSLSREDYTRLYSKVNMKENNTITLLYFLKFCLKLVELCF